ncbi:putative iron compound ABC transporter, ATP-binding protein [Sterolibacterium denitrificans]|uniref:Iron compound ABC transporter, ATP-binding protein n=1 Tax=Sterolibacterium denitrificans TaxID=157592 RepID=A0A7Z7HSM5_9PROT|nr:ABC transporter ATP-binding protein [Sterolibacterium denitrificans]SMB28679.1 putative iron compound ABC transporter, ATP-binding protein [Sterolibacterium denitrificans]
MIEARGIRFAYHGRRVLDGASLSLAAGELVCLLGANGAGKSTLLKLMLGVLKPLHGTVTLDGRALPGYSRRQLAQRIAYVPQVHVAPFPYSVREIVLMGRLPAAGIFRAASAADHDKVEEIIQRIGIAHLAERPYTEISGGERQLALIARALAQEASLLVMDEPLASLDYGHQMRLLARLEQLAAEGYGILMTTHDPDQPLLGCDRVALLIDGRIAADGRPDAVLTPESIERLYGVRVHLVRAADGAGIAFRSRERRDACAA